MLLEKRRVIFAETFLQCGGGGLYRLNSEDKNNLTIPFTLHHTFNCLGAI